MKYFRLQDPSEEHCCQNDHVTANGFPILCLSRASAPGQSPVFSHRTTTCTLQSPQTLTCSYELCPLNGRMTFVGCMLWQESAGLRLKEPLLGYKRAQLNQNESPCILCKHMAKRSDSDPDSMVMQNRKNQVTHYLSQWSKCFKKKALLLPRKISKQEQMDFCISFMF